jgi:hypothetical protein
MGRAALSTQANKAFITRKASETTVAQDGRRMKIDLSLIDSPFCSRPKSGKRGHSGHRRCCGSLPQKAQAFFVAANSGQREMKAKHE